MPVVLWQNEQTSNMTKKVDNSNDNFHEFFCVRVSFCIFFSCLWFAFGSGMPSSVAVIAVSMEFSTFFSVAFVYVCVCHIFFSSLFHFLVVHLLLLYSGNISNPFNRSFLGGRFGWGWQLCSFGIALYCPCHWCVCIISYHLRISVKYFA